MHDCCQGLDALRLTDRTFSSGIHFEHRQWAESIMLAKTMCWNAHHVHSLNCHVLIQVWVDATICCCTKAALAS